MTVKRTFLILGIVAAVLIVLFVISVAHDSDDGPGGGCAADRRDAWRKRLLGASAVEPGQLSGCTTKLAPFTFSGLCVLGIAASDARSRQLTITATDAITLHLDTHADGRTITTHDTVKAGQRRQIFIGKDGQAITLVCPTGTCRARLSSE
jgi:hypothetical protein